MNQKDITKLNHSLRYNNPSTKEESDLYDDYEYFYGKSCPVCDESYLEIEWEPMITKCGDVVEYVYCPSCLSRVTGLGGEIIYNAISKTWNEKYLPVKRK